MLDGCVPWPEATAAAYREAGFWRGETLGKLLRDWARAYGSRTALVGGDRRFTYAELDAWADRLAAGFASRGIRRGERVVVQLPNIPEFVAVCFGLFRLGALPVFALTAHRRHEIGHLCGYSDAVAYVVPDIHQGFDHRELAQAVRTSVPSLREVFVAGDPGPHSSLDELSSTPAPTPVQDAPLGADPGDAAFFLLSGGTTALPKLIPRTHDDYAYQIRAASEICELDGDTVYLAVLPIEFNFTWGCPGVLGTLSAGGTVVLAKTPNPDECFALIERERVTITSCVPTVAHMWLDAARWSERDLSSLSVLQIGSAKLHPEVAERITPALGCRLQQVFGMAEGLLTFTRYDDPLDRVLTTQGRPISPADEIRVVDTEDRPVRPGETGELLTRGPYTLRGYYRAEEHNARAFTEDGFYRTGDLVRFTDDGDMVVQGRIKDVIIRGGDKVSATEVEGHLTAAHDGIQQAAVVPMPDAVMGERVCAFVVLDGEPPAVPEVRRLLRARGLAEFKLPDRIEVIDVFPLTGLGKVDKRALAAELAQRLGTSD
ncbi:(2,3-dihydroxybenzoyl)adenylate synthase [Dactylosporangium fulvum]|uniref:AMP-binding protein n=1 Tax=Dactylosporangium fulvum TaxID=53359 RepID=A0ABY5W9L6_9ACTN|nr:AMP-binding protein [Dactylosporangium fulvum]UWP85378.1 AMP-binding protein [Dactylosporangium fulvum]